MNYQARVNENLGQMNAPMSEWAAVEITGMAKTDDGKPMPVFNFPKGYKKAPSVYKITGQNMNCELCSHPIKNAYWVQNDSKKWTMIVGSECVTHFAQMSGVKLAKSVVWEQNRQLLRDAIATHQAVAAKNTKRLYRNGRFVQRVQLYAQNFRLYQELGKITKGRLPDDPGRMFMEADSNGIVTRWANRNGNRAREIMQALSVCL